MRFKASASIRSRPAAHDWHIHFSRMQPQGADHNAGVAPRQPRRLTFAPAPRDAATATLDAARGQQAVQPVGPSSKGDAGTAAASAATKPATPPTRRRAVAALLSPVGLLVLAFGLIALMILARPAPGGPDASSALALGGDSAAPTQPAVVPPSPPAAAAETHLGAEVVAGASAQEAAPSPVVEHPAASGPAVAAGRADSGPRADPSPDSMLDVAPQDPPGPDPIVGRPATSAPAIGAKDPPLTASRRSPQPATSARSPADRASQPRATASNAQRGSRPPTAPTRLSACDRLSGLREAQCRQCSAMGLIAREFCGENVRLTWCANRWGRSADCPVAGVTTPN